jgi:hypothetical protein
VTNCSGDSVDWCRKPSKLGQCFELQRFTCRDTRDEVHRAGATNDVLWMKRSRPRQCDSPPGRRPVEIGDVVGLGTPPWILDDVTGTAPLASGASHDQAARTGEVEHGGSSPRR